MKLFVVLLLICSGLRAEPICVDIADEAGIKQRNTSEILHKRWLLESTGSSAAFFYCNADGELDLRVLWARAGKCALPQRGRRGFENMVVVDAEDRS